MWFGFISSFPPVDVSLRHFMELLLSKQLLQTAVSRRWWQGLCRGLVTHSVIVLREARTCLCGDYLRPSLDLKKQRTSF